MSLVTLGGCSDSGGPAEVLLLEIGTGRCGEANQGGVDSFSSRPLISIQAVDIATWRHMQGSVDLSLTDEKRAEIEEIGSGPWISSYGLRLTVGDDAYCGTATARGTAASLQGWVLYGWVDGDLLLVYWDDENSPDLDAVDVMNRATAAWSSGRG